MIPEPEEVYVTEVRPNRLELVDYIAISSGQVLIGDPGYLKAWTANEFVSKPAFGGLTIGKEGLGRKKVEPTKEYSFDGACTASQSEKECGPLSIVEKQKAQIPLAVVAKSEPGVHPVYIERNELGEIVAVHIEFGNMLYEGEGKDNDPDIEPYENPKDWLNE